MRQLVSQKIGGNFREPPWSTEVKPLYPIFRRWPTEDSYFPSNNFGGSSPAKDKAKLKKKVLQIVSLFLVVRVQLFSFSNENNTSSYELKKILEEK
jgi:hypothetical protein